MKCVIYKHGKGDIKLRLDCNAIEGIEQKLGRGIPSVISDPDNFKNCVEIIAGAVIETGADENGRRKIAYDIYEDMLEHEKNFTDYQLLMFELLVNAGFMRGKVLERIKSMAKTVGEKATGISPKSSETSSRGESEPE